MTTIVERLSGRDIQICSDAAEDVCALSELAVNQSGQVAGFAADSDLAISRRLFDLGFAVGTPVQLVRKAPMGDPLMFKVADSEMLLRARDACCVLVRVG